MDAKRGLHAQMVRVTNTGSGLYDRPKGYFLKERKQT